MWFHMVPSRVFKIVAATLNGLLSPLKTPIIHPIQIQKKPYLKPLMKSNFNSYFRTFEKLFQRPKNVFHKAKKWTHQKLLFLFKVQLLNLQVYQTKN
jgi:hypothetical protein